MSISIDAFPCPETERLYKAGDSSWVEINQENFYYFLEVLPPIRMKDTAFMVGECYTHDNVKGAMYDACITVDGRYFMRLAPLKSFDPSVYYQEVRKQFNIA
jgi:hypothetical protein